MKTLNISLSKDGLFFGNAEVKILFQKGLFCLYKTYNTAKCPHGYATYTIGLTTSGAKLCTVSHYNKAKALILLLSVRVSPETLRAALEGKKVEKDLFKEQILEAILDIKITYFTLSGVADSLL